MIGFVTRGRTPNCGGRRDFLITAETSLIARFNSLQGRKKFPVRMRRELARKKLISCSFSLPPRRRRGLELAAGTGIVTRAMARTLPAAVAITATDLNPAMLVQAKSHAGLERVQWQ